MTRETQPWLWTVVAGLIFATLVFVDFVPEFNMGSGLSCWQVCTYAWEHPEGASVLYLAIFMVALAVLAIAGGWVVQALIVTLFWRAVPKTERDRSARTEAT